MAVRVKPAARRDLLAIRQWSEDNWGLARTDEFLGQMIETIERLNAHPMMGRSRSVFFQGLRSIRFRGYAIFYVIETAGPVIVAVLHERRNHAAMGFADRMEGDQGG